MFHPTHTDHSLVEQCLVATERDCWCFAVYLFLQKNVEEFNKRIGVFYEVMDQCVEDVDLFAIGAEPIEEIIKQVHNFSQVVDKNSTARRFKSFLNFCEEVQQLLVSCCLRVLNALLTQYDDIDAVLLYLLNLSR